jgi:phage major head subunit gpT-like protein
MLIKVFNTTNGIGDQLTTEDLQGILDEIFNQQRDIVDGTPINDAFLSLATAVQANSGSRIFNWLESIPGVKEWIGSKQYSDIKERNYMIRNKYYYNALTLHKKEIRQNGLVDVPMLTRRMLENQMDHKKELIVEALTAGTTNVAFDGVAFFSNVATGRLNDNLLAGSGITIENLKADIRTARTTMMKFVNSKGKFLRLMPDTIVCPVALEGLFKEIKTATNDVTLGNMGVQNVVGSYIGNIISDPVLDADDVNDWYFLATSKSLKPLIIQTEDMNNGQEYESVIDMARFASDGIIGYSIESGLAVGYGFPETALKIVNS